MEVVQFVDVADVHFLLVQLCFIEILKGKKPDDSVERESRKGKQKVRRLQQSESLKM